MNSLLDGLTAKAKMIIETETAARRAKHLRQQQVPHRQVKSLQSGLAAAGKTKK
ncbi:hypothetical protein [Rheinheimera texasensis]|uniref:hypothetical protein n=1 Tax=Rheinheimera texasensis TaxID=306205 RepID=UPI0032B1C312